MLSGETVKQVRMLKGLTQKGIAKKLGISQPAYSKLEKRKCVDEEQLKIILAFCKCSEKDLELIKKITPPAKHNVKKVRSFR